MFASEYIRANCLNYKTGDMIDYKHLITHIWLRTLFIRLKNLQDLSTLNMKICKIHSLFLRCYESMQCFMKKIHEQMNWLFCKI